MRVTNIKLKMIVMAVTKLFTIKPVKVKENDRNKRTFKHR